MRHKELNQRSLLLTRDLLVEIIKNPNNFKGHEALVKALNSQSGLAKYVDEERGIVFCSLNTYKTSAEALLERGFVEIDEMRVSARNALESASSTHKGNTRTRTGLSHKVVELKEEVDTLSKQNFLLTMLVSELAGELKHFAESSEDEQLAARYSDLNKKIEAKLSYTNNGML